MDIEVEIEDVYPIGSATPKQLVIVFESMWDKRMLFQNKKKVYDLENSIRQKYYFSNYLPATINEERMREREIFLQNKKKKKAQQIEMELRAGRVKIKR